MSAAAEFARALSGAGAALGFQHDGVVYFNVPACAVEAYAAARLAREPAEAILQAIMVAYVGEAVWQAFSGHADWTFWRIGRAWCVRLADLERRARGLPRAAA